MKAIAHASEMARAQVDMDQAVIGEIVREVASPFGADLVLLFLYGSDGKPMYASGSGATPEQIRRAEELLQSEAASRYLDGATRPIVLRRAQLSSVSRAKDAITFETWARSVGADTLVLCPLSAGRPDGKQNRHGFLLLAHTHSHPPYDGADLLALRTLSNILAVAADNHRLTSAQEEEYGARDRFLSLLSHELRTPLTSIMGFTQLIRKRLSNSSLADARLLAHLDVLWSQSQRLSRLIDTFVDLSKIERGEFTVSLARVDLASTLRRAVEQALSQSHSRGNVVLDVPEGPIWVHGNEKRLEQVFQQVLSNAIHYSPENQPIHIVCEELPQEGKVSIAITDQGPGIPPAVAEKVFERFYQKDRVKSGGLGVGLYLSKMILQAHGGHISLQSAKDKGTTVSILLPV